MSLNPPIPPLTTPHISSRGPDEPADKWASSTVNAPGPVKDSLVNSTATTPGCCVPGAYPELHPSPNGVQQDMEYMKETTLNALSVAKEYVGHAGGAVTGYLGPTVSAYLRSRIQTEETTHTSDEVSVRHHGPGTSSSEGVLDEGNNNGYVPEMIRSEDENATSKFPVERRQENLPRHDDEGVTRLDTPAGVEGLPRYLGELVNHVPREEAEEESFATTSSSSNDKDGLLAPTTEREKEASANVSIETLPGSRVESARTDALNVVRESGTSDGDESQWSSTAVRSSPPYNGQSIPSTPTTHTHAAHPNTSARRQTVAAGGTEISHTPAAEEARREQERDEEKALQASMSEERQGQERVASDVATPGHGGPATAPQTTTTTTASAPHPTTTQTGGAGKKLGFIEKLKGEMKIFSGKLEHRKQKVGEGKKILGKN